MESVICTVDVVLLTLRAGSLQVALYMRDKAPFQGAWALPGGYVHVEADEDAEQAAARVLHEKTGIVSPYLEQLATFSGRARDPRGWSVSISYYALVPVKVIEQAERSDLKLVGVEQLKSLPFDHLQIIHAALERVRSKSTYSSLPVYLCNEQFTLPQLQTVYETLLNEPINKVSFRRKMDELGILEPVIGAVETGKANRPAQYYRVKAQFRHTLSQSGRGLNPGS
ncbi:MAG: NUDIX hydrolase [Uliginosibacterium sp.]|jgi:8-oxo-dGTP diphosphatase|nr:NUDIX hydrolase [Uliginosibacterium sp.]MBK9394243.1 NUDIX hydrolase [Uliginosibacterium sp.]MBK9614273.1 NUDIX hydrolase [Uliginosibacterium sp.]